jgi:hypothetical protein
MASHRTKPYTHSNLLERDVMAQAYLAPASNSMVRRIEFRRRSVEFSSVTDPAPASGVPNDGPCATG